MTTGQALKYVLAEAAKLGYNDLSFEATYEIYDRLNRLPETNKEVLDKLVELMF